VETTVAAHGCVAYVDAQRTLDARDWVHLGDAEGMWMIRPHDATRAAWCADVLLRSGAFALVVLDGAPTLTKSNAVRLTRLARESSCALVMLGDRTGAATQLGGAVRLVVERQRPERRRHPPSARQDDSPGSTMRGSTWPDDGSDRESSTRTIGVRVEKGGTLRTVEVGCAIAVARRLCTHPEVPDRRGVARGPAGGSRHARAGRPAPAPTPAPAHATGRTASVAAAPPRELHTAVARARALG
jgi:hypothetical protein